MVAASDFQVGTVQAVIYTPNTSEFSQPKILTSILTSYVSRYDGAVASLPLPGDAPPELPRIVLQSIDGVWRLNAAPSRIDSIWMATSAQPSIATQHSDTQEIVRDCAKVLEEYVRNNDVHVNRLALVIGRACEDLNPAQALIDRFCNEESKTRPFRHSQNFEIHNHKLYQLLSLGIKVNSWVRCRTGSLLQRSAITIEQDINTYEQDHHTFTPEQIEQFFFSVLEEADKIMQIYFPQET